MQVSKRKICYIGIALLIAGSILFHMFSVGCSKIEEPSIGMQTDSTLVVIEDIMEF